MHSLNRQVSSQAVISSCQCLAGLSRTLCLDGGICTGSPHRPERVLEGPSQIHQYNTSHHGMTTGTLGPIFISSNNSLMLGGESHLSMSASLPVVWEWEWWCVLTSLAKGDYYVFCSSLALVKLYGNLMIWAWLRHSKEKAGLVLFGLFLI